MKRGSTPGNGSSGRGPNPSVEAPRGRGGPTLVAQPGALGCPASWLAARVARSADDLAESASAELGVRAGDGEGRRGLAEGDASAVARGASCFSASGEGCSAAAFAVARSACRAAAR